MSQFWSTANDFYNEHVLQEWLARIRSFDHLMIDVNNVIVLKMYSVIIGYLIDSD